MANGHHYGRSDQYIRRPGFYGMALGIHMEWGIHVGTGMGTEADDFQIELVFIPIDPGEKFLFRQLQRRVHGHAGFFLVGKVHVRSRQCSRAGCEDQRAQQPGSQADHFPM